MMRRFLPLALAALLPAGVAAPAAAQQSAGIPWRCGDLVVVGRVHTRAFTPGDGPQDAKLTAKLEMQVRIGKVLQGSERRSKVSAVGVSNVLLRDDTDFLMVLRPVAGSDYKLALVAPWSRNPSPQLAASCTPTS